MKVKRIEPQCHFFDGRVIVFGGYGYAAKSLEIYDVKQGKWTEKHELEHEIYEDYCSAVTGF